MTHQELLTMVEERAQKWLDPFYDETTRAEVLRMLNNADKTELIDSFYKDIEFGTGGLRGVMGAGTNRMNRYTLGAATQGLSNYLLKAFAQLPEIKVVIGHDCRHNSRYYAETCAGIFAANGIRALLFEDLRPTPEMSFAIREYGCQSGIILTASHNPPEYNGYKAYWNDGAQIVAPHDDAIIAEVKSIAHSDIQFSGPGHLITALGEETDLKFIERVKQVSISPDVVEKYRDMKIVYTPIHGTGVRLIPMALKAFGFQNIINVPEQDIIDGNFPTVVSPNPEEPEAMKMGIERAIETDAEVVMASDPDADRLGVAVRNLKGEFVIINGNQTALLFIYYVITKLKEQNALTGNEYVVKTIVSTEVIAEIARRNQVEYYDTYTGFKFIAEVIRENEGIKRYLGGGEESFGFLPADFVRDKDAVTSIALMAEIVAWAKDRGKSLYELLLDIYITYGFSKEKTISITRRGQTGAAEIEAMMVRFRNNPPRMLGGSRIAVVKDYSTRIATNHVTGEATAIEQKTTSNVLQFFTESGTKISVRPSGTEPKIKFYFEVKGQLNSRAEAEALDAALESQIDAMLTELGL